MKNDEIIKIIKQFYKVWSQTPNFAYVTAFHSQMQKLTWENVVVYFGALKDTMEWNSDVYII